jgi:ATP-dependent DNA helicase RecG
MNKDPIVILKALLALPRETEWVEWKHNNEAPEEIGEYVSALANSAALHGKPLGYIVWGVEDGTKRVVGTTFSPSTKNIGNEDFVPWLVRLLHPRVDFRVYEFAFEGLPMVIFEVPATRHTPVRWKDSEWIRVGSYKKPLRDYPEKERSLWQLLTPGTFETELARTGLSGDEALAALDYTKFFELLGAPLPPDRAALLARLSEDKLLVRSGPERFDITNLGAILFAKDLRQFEALKRKAIRLIRYKGEGRLETEREVPIHKGYACGFEELVTLINSLLPQNEVLGQALRKEIRMYPDQAIRELVPNAMVHQDFAITGTGPMIEVFDDRLEISNPGLPLIDTLRFLDHSPRSRNEDLAGVMRRLGICEERGSGIDKVIASIEVFQLPPPDFRTDQTHTRVVLFAHRGLGEMDKDERIRACYQHACLNWVTGSKATTNEMLRQRFSIEAKNYPVASRIIADTIKEKLLKPQDPGNKSRKHAKYLPFWA